MNITRRTEGCSSGAGVGGNRRGRHARCAVPRRFLAGLWIILLGAAIAIAAPSTLLVAADGWTATSGAEATITPTVEVDESSGNSSDDSPPVPSPTATPTVQATQEALAEEPATDPPTEEPLPTAEGETDDGAEVAGQAGGASSDGPEPMPAVPVVSLVATGSCTGPESDGGMLTLTVTDAVATIVDVRVLWQQDQPPKPATLTVTLPELLDPGVVAWSWSLDVPAESAPVALLVRVAELPGTEEANRVAGDGQSGWLQAELRSPADCPTPTSTAKPIEATPEPTATDDPEPIATPSATPSDTVTTDPAPTHTSDTAVLPEATPTSTEGTSTEPITVAALTKASVAVPGQSVDQTFRVRNTTDEAMTVRLTVSTSLPRWQTDIFEMDGTTPITGSLLLEPHTHWDVIVRVTVPSDAHVGDRNTTTLDARPEEPSS